MPPSKLDMTRQTWYREKRRRPFLLHAEDQALIESTGSAYCPHCGIHLSNGLQDFENMLDSHNNQSEIEPITHEFLCLGCGEEFGEERALPVKKTIVNKSTVEGPCALVWNLAEEMVAQGARRKDVIAEAQNRGVAYYTARTQYQAWKAAKNNS